MAIVLMRTKKTTRTTTMKRQQEEDRYGSRTMVSAVNTAPSSSSRPSCDPTIETLNDPNNIIRIKKGFKNMSLNVLAVVVSLVLLMGQVDVGQSHTPSLIPKQSRRKTSSLSKSSTATSAMTTIQNTSRHQQRQQQRQQQPQQAPWVTGIKNSMASALAAGCSKLILAPFDTIKTLQQSSRVAAAAAAGGSSASAASSSSSLTLLQAAKAIMSRPRGVLEFYAGVGVAVVGSMPSVGLYFGIYSYCKKTFQQWDPDHYDDRQTFYIALSAAIGNTIASASRVPYEVVKQKFQTKVYTSMADCISDLSFRTLFPVGGIASQMLRDIPYAVVTLLAYEHLKTVWKPRTQRTFPNVPTRSWDLMVGGLAGGIGSWVTNPMDVIKTRLQTDVGSGSSGGSSLYGGSIVTCAQKTWAEGGPSAFLRGSVPRLLHKVPANAFFFLFYELFRTVLGVQDDDGDNKDGTTDRTGKR